MSPGFIVAFVIFAAIVIVACIVIFIIFIVKGVKGAKDQKRLFEKGQISQEEYDSNFNQGTSRVINENYAIMRNLSEEDRKQLESWRKMNKNKAEPAESNAE